MHDINVGRPQTSTATSLFVHLPPPPAPRCDSYRTLMDQVEVAAMQVVRPGHRSRGDRSKDRVPLPPPLYLFFPSPHQITTGGHLKQSSIIEVNLHTGQSYTSHTWNCTRVCEVVAHTCNFSFVVVSLSRALFWQNYEFTCEIAKHNKTFPNY